MENVRDLYLDRAVANAIETREAMRGLLGQIVATLSIEKNWDAMKAEGKKEREEALAGLRCYAHKWKEQYESIERHEFGVFAGAFYPSGDTDKKSGK